RIHQTEFMSLAARGGLGAASQPHLAWGRYAARVSSPDGCRDRGEKHGRATGGADDAGVIRVPRARAPTSPRRASPGVPRGAKEARRSAPRSKVTGRALVVRLMHGHVE